MSEYRLSDSSDDRKAICFSQSDSCVCRRRVLFFFFLSVSWPSLRKHLIKCSTALANMHSVKWREGKRADLQTSSEQERKGNGDNPILVSLVHVPLCQRSIVDDADEQELSSSLRLNSKHERILFDRRILDAVDDASARFD